MMSFGKDTRIVIVEDNILSRITLKKMINNINGQKVIADFDNAEDCLNFVRQNQTDLVIMDIMLPYMNGIEASKRLKKYNNSIKIIIVTPNNSEAQLITSLFAIGDAYYIRDFKQEKLIKVLNRTMSGVESVDKRIEYSVFKYIKTLPEKEYRAILEKLTQNETKFMTFVSMGLSKYKISELLNTPVHNLTKYIHSILEKVNETIRIENLGRELKYDLL